MTGSQRRVGFDLAVSSIAVVGASESSFWTSSLIRNLQHYGFPGDIYAINRRPGVVLGLPVHQSVAALPAPPDLGVIAIGADRCLEVVEDLARSGCRRIVVMSDGFADAGSEHGVRLQEEIRACCTENDIAFLGPNCVGVADFSAGVVAIGEPIPLDIEPGPVSVVAHSGGVLSSLLSNLGYENIGIDKCFTIGNGAGVGLEEIFEELLERDSTQIVCAYLENLGGTPRSMTDLFRRYRDAGKRIIVVKTGRGETAQRISVSHTAQAAGPDALVAAILRRGGVLRSDDIAELARLALFDALPDNQDPGSGVAFVGSSGGAASVAADLSNQLGVRLAEFLPETTARLTELVPEEGYPGNPLDLSGRSGGGTVDTRAIFETFLADPNVVAPIYLFSAVLPTDAPERIAHRAQLELLHDVAASLRRPVVVSTLGRQRSTLWFSEYVRSAPWLIYAEGLELTLRALGKRYPTRPRRDAPPSPEVAPAGFNPLVWSEAAGRDLATRLGFPCVEGYRCGRIDEALTALEEVGGTAIVKSILPGIAHKAAVGAVVRDVASPAQLRSVFDDLSRRAAELDLVFEGVMVERTAIGSELLVGLTRDERFGTFLTLGLDGARAEDRSFKATRLLPLAGQDEVAEMYAEAGLDTLLGGRPQWLPTLCTSIVALSEGFDRGMPGVETIELNPVFVADPDGVVAADVLVVATA